MPWSRSATRFAARRLIAGSLLLAGGCSSWRVQPVSPAQLVAERHPSQVRVQRQDGTRVVLRQPAVRGDSLVSQRAGDSTGVYVRDISAAAVRRFDPVATVGLVAGIFAVAAIACAAACEFGPDFSFAP